MNLNKKVFRDPNAEKNYTLLGLVKKERVEAGFFFPPDGLYILLILQRVYSPLKLTEWPPLKVLAYGQIQLPSSNIKSNIGMSGFRKRNVLSGKCLTVIEIALP